MKLFTDTRGGRRTETRSTLREGLSGSPEVSSRSPQGYRSGTGAVRARRGALAATLKQKNLKTGTNAKKLLT